MTEIKTEIKADVTIDCKGLNCPMPILNMKKAVDKMEVGQILRMEATDQGSVNDVQAWAKRTGNEVLESKQEGKIFIFYIKKKG